MIASVAFRNFKALRNAHLALAPCNIVVGPNGSGKTSLIQALLRLRAMAKLPLKPPVPPAERRPEAAEIRFRFTAPFTDCEAVLGCVRDTQCDLLEIRAAPDAPAPAADAWPALRDRLLGVRAYLLDHYAIALPAPLHAAGPLASNGGNLAAIVARWREQEPAVFAGLQEDFRRLVPEHEEIAVLARDGGTVEIALRLREGGDLVLAENLSQGTLYALALCVLAHDPAPPSVVCLEEVDRGLHPRRLREVRDLLYRLSYPGASGVARAPVQVIATTHSPYLLDQFREHPEEIVVAERHGDAASFARLADRDDLAELLAGGSLGDIWYSGILGGVPDEP